MLGMQQQSDQSDGANKRARRFCSDKGGVTKENPAMIFSFKADKRGMLKCDEGSSWFGSWYGFVVIMIVKSSRLEDGVESKQ